MKISRWESINISSELFMKYGKDFALTEKKTLFLVLRDDSGPSFMQRMKQKTSDLFV
jgi:BRCT domain type II-containing protein